jgi:sugar phosphate isomerase/epimerase
MNVLFEPEPKSVHSALERLARAGFQVLDFDFCDWLFEGSPLVGDGWESWIKSIRQHADRLGLQFTQMHGPIFNKFGDEEKTKWFMAMSHRALEAASLLGCSWVVLELEPLPGAFDNQHLQQLKERNIAWIAELLPTAERCGVGIAIENNADVPDRERKRRRAYGSTPAELIDLVDTFNHPLLGICWDTGHAHIQRLEQAAALKAIGKRLKATHIQDNNGEQDQHLLPFHGTIDWQSVVTALREIGYEGDFVYEVHNFVRPLPDRLRDAVLRYAVEIGRFLLNENPL